MNYEKEIETPLGKHKVKIKTMLTGAERERVDNAEMAFVKTEDGKNFTVSDMAKVALAKRHELLRTCVLSIDGDATDCFPRLQKMFEPDYLFVYSAIEEEQKKMML
jgi:hypothetical protein